MDRFNATLSHAGMTVTNVINNNQCMLNIYAKFQPSMQNTVSFCFLYFSQKCVDIM